MKECKGAQDKMKYRMGEIIWGEIWEIQVIKNQQQSSEFDLMKDPFCICFKIASV